jgi:hypothetical protein
VILGIIASLIIGFSNDTLDSEGWLIATFKDDIPLLTVVPDSSSKSSYRRDRYGRYKYKYSQSYTSGAIKSKKISEFELETEI